MEPQGCGINEGLGGLELEEPFFDVTTSAEKVYSEIHILKQTRRRKSMLDRGWAPSRPTRQLVTSIEAGRNRPTQKHALASKGLNAEHAYQ